MNMNASMNPKNYTTTAATANATDDDNNHDQYEIISHRRRLLPSKRIGLHVLAIGTCMSMATAFPTTSVYLLQHHSNSKHSSYVYHHMMGYQSNSQSRRRLHVASSTTTWDAATSQQQQQQQQQQPQQQYNKQGYIEEIMQCPLQTQGSSISSKTVVVEDDTSSLNRRVSDGSVDKKKSKEIVRSLKSATLERSRRKQISRSSTMPGYRITNSNIDSRQRTQKRKGAGQALMYEGSASVPDSLIDFTEEIHAESRITPAEEVTLGSKTQELIRLERLYNNLEAELNRKPTDDEWCSAAGKINMTCLTQCLEEGKAAKDKLVVSNLRMVQRVVNLYIRNGLGSEYNAGDMMQEGTMALIRAAEKFEPTKGFRFSTYAMYWIRASVKRSQMLQSRIIAIPQRVHETHKRVTKIEAELRSGLDRDPTKEEIAEAANIRIDQLDNVMDAMNQQVMALDKNIENNRKPGRSDKQTDMHEIIADIDITEYANDTALREELINSLRRHLTPIEVKILCLRYGLLDARVLPPGFGGPLTIREVGLLVGLKPDKVRRTINKSLRQLKYLIAHEWPEFSQEILEELKENESVL